MLRDAERKILHLLQQEGRISNVELAARVGLSESPCLRRVKQLEDARVITGYAAHVDRRKVGLDVVAFIQVHLDQRTESVTQKFVTAVRDEPRIVECYAVSGAYDYLIKAVARNLDEFSDLAMRRILRFPGVKDITTGFVLEDVKEPSPLPL